MKRRFLLGLLPCLTLVWPRALRSERHVATMARIGWLSSGVAGREVQAFREAFRDAGYIDGQSYTMILRFAEGQLERLDGLAQELVAEGVDVIVAAPTSGALAARRATTSIPIVVPISLDAVRAGVVSSLARPGGNVTGLTLMSVDLVGKRLELLREALPRLEKLALLVPAGVPDLVRPFVEEATSTASALGIGIVPVESRDANDLEVAFRSMVTSGVQALYILESQALFVNRESLFRLAAEHKLPAISGAKSLTYARNGTFMSYGPDIWELYRRAAELVVKILGGAKPDELPMEQPTNFELVINLGTASALGIRVPSALLARADEVIE
jgi:putative tryptophan/tyrosine transport system substrate-binding protein